MASNSSNFELDLQTQPDDSVGIQLNENGISDNEARVIRLSGTEWSGSEESGHNGSNDFAHDSPTELDLIQARNHKKHLEGEVTVFGWKMPSFGRSHIVEGQETIAEVDRELEFDELKDSVLGRDHSRRKSIAHIAHQDEEKLKTRVAIDQSPQPHNDANRVELDSLDLGDEITPTPSPIVGDEIIPKKKNGDKPDIYGAIFNLMNYVLGAGILGLPYAFSQAGLLVGATMVVVVGCATVFSFYLLLWSSHASQAYGYEQLARASYGNGLATAVKLIIIVDSFGPLSAYMIVTGETTTKLAISYFGTHWYTSKLFILSLAVLFIMFPLCCLKNINYLGFTSGLSLVPLVYLLVLQVYFFIASGGPQSGLPLVASGFFVALPIVTFSYSSHQALFPLYTELQERNGTDKDIFGVVWWSMGLSGLCYLFSGTIGVLTYPTNAAGNILNNLPPGYAVDLLLLTTALSIVLSFPVILWPARVSADRLFFIDKEYSYLRFVLEAAAILIMSFAIAVLIPSFSTVLGLFGSLTSTTIGYILPPLYFIKLDSTPFGQSKVKKVALTLGIIGCLAGLISAGVITYDYIQGLIKGSIHEGDLN